MFLLTGSFKLNIKILKKAAVACFFLLFSVSYSKAQLIINEVSQGPTGSQEYVELLVVGTSSCTSVSCLDLRGYYIDDNNGSYATGTGTGIAQGCIRFKNTSLWSCIPVGTLIVIYNDADPNPTIPAQDLSLADGNARLIIPVSNCTLLEVNIDYPSISSSAYPTTGFNSCGDWATLAMANGDDSFQTIDPSGNTVFSVSWGNNTTNTMIYFSGSSSAMVAYMANTIDDTPNSQGNWERIPAVGNETPGNPNNAANAAWINSMNNLLNASFNADILSGCEPFCSNFTDASVSVGSNIVEWYWDFGDSSFSDVQHPQHCFNNQGTYSVTLTVTSGDGCTSSVTNTNMIILDSEPVADFILPDIRNIFESEISFTDNSTGATSWNWNFGDASDLINNTSSLTNPTHTYTEPGYYCVTLAIANNAGCKDTNQQCFEINSQYTFYIPNAFSPNGDGKNDEFYGKGEGILEFEITIYDRWGNVVFASKDINEHWNGKSKKGNNLLQQDSYVYNVVIKDKNKDRHQYTGNIIVAR